MTSTAAQTPGTAEEEIAGAAVFLASRASYYITGTAIPVDSGSTSF